jgi:hypothetical protein
MKFIKTNFFNSQVLELSKKYKKINADILFFENNFELEPFSDL